MKKIILLIFLSFMISFPAYAVTSLDFDIQEDRIYKNDIFPVSVVINSDVPINTIQADISFPIDKLEIVAVEKGRSILSIWPQEPSFSNSLGLASFIGGLPDPGFNRNNGMVGIVYFRAKEVGKVELRFERSTKALLNDGLGGKAQLISSQLEIDIHEAPKGYIPKEKELPIDDLSPEELNAFVIRTDLAFDGKYIAIFQATDLHSGISHYEIKEEGEDWVVALSPYVLKNQNVKSEVLVRAVDRAGNTIISKVDWSTHNAINLTNTYYIAGIVFLFGLGLYRYINRTPRWFTEK